MRYSECLEEIVPQVLLHAEQQYPRECCGPIVLARGRVAYYPAANNSDKLDAFVMDAKDFLKATAQGDIIAIAHSHPDGEAQPSPADTDCCNQFGIPSIIVSHPKNDHTIVQPDKLRELLLGHVFEYGKNDCYTLLQNYFRLWFNIQLADYPSEFGWWDKGQDLYLDNAAAQGFMQVPMDQLAEYDVILMAIHTKKPDHAAIYVGKNEIFHHPLNRLSCRENYDGMWRRMTHSVWRHKDLL
jgi:proteasome lid subunit RPN8/RPN11